MESKPKSKIYLAILILFLCMSVAVIAAFSVLSLTRYGRDVISTGEISENITYIYDAQLYFEKMRSYQKNLLIYSGELEQLDQIKDAIYENRELILKNLEAFMVTGQMYSTFHEQDRIRNLRALLEEHYAYTMEMIDQAMLGDTYALNEIMTNTTPLAVEINNSFSELSMMARDVAMMMRQKTTVDTHQSIIIITILSVLAVISILIASIAIMRKIENNCSDDYEAVKHSHNRYSDNLSQRETILMSDLERCVSDLKAVAYDLSRTSKEIKK